MDAITPIGEGRVARPIRLRAVSRLPKIDFEAAFAAVSVWAGLFPIYLGSATGLIFILLPTFYVLQRPERVFPLFVRVSFLLTLPALTILSALWSPFPGSTIYYGAQFSLTMLAGVIVGAGSDPRRALTGLFFAALIHMIAVLVYAEVSGKIEILLALGADDPFVGLAGSKNNTSDMAILGLMTAVATLMLAQIERRFGLALLALGVIAGDMVIIISAKSAGTSIAGIIGVTVLLGFSIMRVLPVAGRMSVLIAAVIGGAIAAATSPIWYARLFETLLRSAGKDETLTGRTYLWSRAEVMMYDRPWLGRGFGSFWRRGDLESEGIWEKAFVEARTGFNFHSSYYEIMVYLGIVGLVLFVAVFVVCIIMLYRRALLRPQPLTSLFCAIIVYDLVRFRFEAFPLGIFAYGTIYLYAALAHGSGLVANFDPRAGPGRSIGWWKMSYANEGGYAARVNEVPGASSDVERLSGRQSRLSRTGASK